MAETDPTIPPGYVAMPSTSSGVSPASRMARRQASSARSPSLRPDCFSIAVHADPTNATWSAKALLIPCDDTQVGATTNTECAMEDGWSYEGRRVLVTGAASGMGVRIVLFNTSSATTHDACS